MNSGIHPNEECQTIYNTQLRVNPSISGISMKYDDKAKAYVLDRVYDKGFDFRELGKDNFYLPKNEGR